MNWLHDSVNQITLVAALLILIITIFIVGFYFKKMKNAKNDGELAEHDWDGIKEFKNNIPIGWIASFAAVIIWGLWYIFVGYPLGEFSQIGQYNEEKQAHNEKFKEKWASLSEKDKVNMGQGIFLVQCSQCHGLNAEGINGKAQNLTEWGKEEGIVNTIKHGSQGLDYPMGLMFEGQFSDLNDEEINAVAAYVMLDLVKADPESVKNKHLAQKGKEIFNGKGTCATCHGTNGDGMNNQAPDLTKYGSYEFVAEVLKKGKKGFIGHMPSFEYANFSEEQKQALAAYINSIRAQD